MSDIQQVQCGKFKIMHNFLNKRPLNLDHNKLLVLEVSFTTLLGSTNIFFFISAVVLGHGKQPEGD